jgi:hypothetical protein
MSLDTVIEMFPNVNADTFGAIPAVTDFPIAYEPTKMPDKRYVLNANTGTYLGIVGRNFTCVDHTEFFTRVMDTVRTNLTVHDLKDARVRWQSGRHGAFALMDVTLPNVTYKVTTKRHQVDVAQRIVALHGVDGLTSNQSYHGAIDAFCTNGMISGDWERVRRKNTSGFRLDNFITELEGSKAEFHAHGRKLQTWADKQLDFTEVKEALPSIVGGERKADKLTALYLNEANTRGHNVFALYSAFTNYSSYADHRNGFELRASDNDNAAMTMFSREQAVTKWVSSPAFAALVA